MARWTLAVAIGVATVLWFVLLALSYTGLPPRRKKVGVIVGVVLLAATAGTSALAVREKHSTAEEKRFAATAPFALA